MSATTPPELESALEPELPILDAHHHLWEQSPHSRFSNYRAADYAKDIESGHRIVGSIYVECGSSYHLTGPEWRRPAGEIAFADRVANADAKGRSHDRIALGIIGYANLLLGKDVQPLLEAYRQTSPHRLCGIRHCSAWDPYAVLQIKSLPVIPKMLADERFKEGLRELARHNLPFDAWLYHPQMDELTETAQALPEVTFVLDHLGGPLGIGPYQGKRTEVWTRWRQSLDRLSRCPNVHVKLGGIQMAVNGLNWNAEGTPATSDELVQGTCHYYEHAIECFTPHRCMFESNFPMDKETCSYTVLWNAFKKMTRSYSTDERRALFGLTAARIYQRGTVPL